VLDGRARHDDHVEDAETAAAKDGDGMIEVQIIRRPGGKWDVVLRYNQRGDHSSAYVPGSPAFGLSSTEAVQAIIGFKDADAVRPDANLFVFDGEGGQMYHGAVYQFLRGDVKLEDLTEAQA
jgi:hypothetical protein